MHAVALVLTAIAGVWLGFAMLFFVFLLAGIPLAVVLAAAFASLCAGLMLNERRTPPGVRPWLRWLSGGSAFGVVLHFIFALAGGWSFGS